MKIVKRILKFIAIVIGVLLISIAVILLVDKQSTNYLKVKNNKSAHNNSFLITNVNIIPMNQDTILVNKMVHIKDGIIQKIADRIEITSAGGLPEGLSKQEFFEGFSVPRNKELMRIFKDLELVEQLGSVFHVF